MEGDARWTGCQRPDHLRRERQAICVGRSREWAIYLCPAVGNSHKKAQKTPSYRTMTLRFYAFLWLFPFYRGGPPPRPPRSPRPPAAPRPPALTVPGGASAAASRSLAKPPPLSV